MVKGKKYDASMSTNEPYQPNKAYAWGAAAQLNMIVDANDPDLWETFFRFLRERKIMDELKSRLTFEFGDPPSDAAQ